MFTGRFTVHSVKKQESRQKKKKKGRKKGTGRERERRNNEMVEHSNWVMTERLSDLPADSPPPSKNKAENLQK